MAGILLPFDGTVHFFSIGGGWGLVLGASIQHVEQACLPIAMRLVARATSGSAGDMKSTSEWGSQSASTLVYEQVYR